MSARINYLVLILATFTLGCSSPETMPNRPAKSILLEIVDNLEIVVQNAGRPQLTEVANELYESSKITADSFQATERNTANEVAGQIEQFAKAIPSESKEDLQRRIENMRSTISQLP